MRLIDLLEGSASFVENTESLIESLLEGDRIKYVPEGEAKTRRTSFWSLEAIEDMGEEAWKEAALRRPITFNLPKALIDLANKHRAALEVVMSYPSTAIAYYEAYKAPEKWPEMEGMLARYPNIAFTYAKATGERFLAAEKTILNSPYAADYAEQVIKGRWPEYEAQIIKRLKAAQRLSWAYTNDVIRYVETVIRGRWPELEEQITASSSPISVDYARDVIKGRWPEYEEAILSGEISPTNSALYARDVIRGRWPEYERYMRDNKDENRLRIYQKIGPSLRPLSRSR